VQHGDTLTGIAAQHNIDYQHLLSLNPQIKNPNLIHPGEPVHLDGGLMAEESPMPTNHTYPPNDHASPTGGAHAPAKLGGLDNGMGNLPANPEHGIVAVDTSHDTNPLRIDHDNKA
jgi:hypothetical protein